MEKEKKQKRMQVLGKKYEPMAIEVFRKAWLKKGYELIDITQLCEFKLGCSGWCNDFNEPDEQIYHVKVEYRDEYIGTLESLDNWHEDYVKFKEEDDFIIFRKAKK